MDGGGRGSGGQPARAPVPSLANPVREAAGELRGRAGLRRGLGQGGWRSAAASSSVGRGRPLANPYVGARANPSVSLLSRARSSGPRALPDEIRGRGSSSVNLRPAAGLAPTCRCRPWSPAPAAGLRPHRRRNEQRSSFLRRPVPAGASTAVSATAFPYSSGPPSLCPTLCDVR
jgi:hypothetical protein